MTEFGWQPILYVSEGRGRPVSRTTLEGQSVFHYSGPERAGPHHSSSFNGLTGWQGSTAENGNTAVGTLGTIMGLRNEGCCVCLRGVWRKDSVRHSRLKTVQIPVIKIIIQNKITTQIIKNMWFLIDNQHLVKRWGWYYYLHYYPFILHTEIKALKTAHKYINYINNKAAHYSKQEKNSQFVRGLFIILIWCSNWVHGSAGWSMWDWANKLQCVCSW